VISVWDVARGKEVRQLRREALPSDRLGFSPDGKRLVAVEGWNLRAWDVKTGKRVVHLEREWCKSFAFSADGKAVVLARTHLGRKLDTLLCRLEQAGWRETARRLPDGLFGADLVFAPRGRVVLTFDRPERPPMLWDVERARALRPLVGAPSGDIAPRGKMRFGPFARDLAAFTADGRTVALWGPSGVQLWEVATGAKRAEVSVPVGPLARRLLEWEKAGPKAMMPPPAPGGVPPGGLFPLPAPAPAAPALNEADRRLGARQAQGWPLNRAPFMALSPDGRRLAVAGEDSTVLILDTARAAGAADLPGLWKALAGDAAGAYRAGLALEAAGRPAVDFLKGRLRPVAPVEAAALAKLLAGLESDDFARRREATEALERLGGMAEPALRKRLAERPPLDAHRRLEELLARVDRRVLTPDQLRELRAVEVLERMKGAEARRLLEALARGAPGAWLTSDAAESLRRMGAVR
jgi:hypothetical protein